MDESTANASSAMIVTFIVVAFIILIVAFFGYTCTSGTFSFDNFSVSNCFVIEGLFTSNTATTQSVTVPDLPCSEWTTLNCPKGRCQVDEVQGVCEDFGEPLERLMCEAQMYQSADTCPLVGCEWGEEQCAQPGELCAYVGSSEACNQRTNCHWDFYRPVYAMCVPKTTALSEVDCSVMNGSKLDCLDAPDCSLTGDDASTCVDRLNTTLQKCKNMGWFGDNPPNVGSNCSGADCSPHTSASTCDAQECCGWSKNSNECKTRDPIHCQSFKRCKDFTTVYTCTTDAEGMPCKWSKDEYNDYVCTKEETPSVTT